MNLLGKTVESVTWNEYRDGEVDRIRFTDGTTLLFSADEYSVTAKLLTDHALAQLERRREVWEARSHRRGEDARRANAIKEARIARARTILSRKAFDRWRRRVYPTHHEVLRDVWSSATILEQLDTSPLLFSH